MNLFNQYRCIEHENVQVSEKDIKHKILSEVSIFQRRYQLWIHNYRSRRSLAKLSQSQLNDIGLTYDEALIESQKPFWK